MNTFCSKAKRATKRLAVFALTLIVALSSVLPAIAATDPTTLDVTFRNGDYSELNGVYTLNKANDNGNNIVPSDASANTFDYSADVQLIDADGAATLVFGYNGGRFNGLELKQDGTSVKVTSFIDKDPDHAYPNNYAFQGIEVADTSVTADFVKVRLTMDENKLLTVYVGGKQVTTYDFNQKEGKEGIPYYPGQLGLMTWNASAKFKNLTATTNDTQAGDPNFNTNIVGDWTNAGESGPGDWTVTESGMRGNNAAKGDTFYTSSKYMEPSKAFVLEADMHLESGQAAGLTFGVKNPDVPKQTWYCVNVDKVMKITKLFKNTGGEVWNVNRPLTDTELKKKDFKVRIEYLEGGRMNFYLDDKLVGYQQENSFAGGYIGIMTFQSDATFNNVMFYEAPTPKLTGLDVKDVEITPTFDDTVYKYSGTVPFETESVQIKANTTDDFDLTINDTPVPKDQYMEVGLMVGNNDILVKATDRDTKLTAITTVSIKRQQDPNFAYTESYRPQFHYSQESGWCNDPNGMVYYEGEWHLFYQYNEQKTWTSMHWGHAVSTDLINWTELPIALYPDELGTIFSGSAVVDEYNTSGFFTDTPEKKGLVAIFTHDGGGQKQSIAYSTDKGRTWTKYEGNPVISSADDPLKDGAFRDPKVFWHKESNQWMMVVAGGPLRFFSSKDLKTWTFESGYNQTQNLNGKSVNGIWTECPDFYRLEVDKTGTYKWVLSLGGRYYMVGDFDKIGEKWYFVPDTNEQFSMNYAPDSYAAQTYFGWDENGTTNGTPDGRRIMINWMSNWGYAGNIANITDPNNGAFTLQHEMTLQKNADGKIRLYQNPIEQYNSLRLTDKATELNTTLTPGGENPLASFSGDQYEIVAEFTPKDGATQVGFKLRTGANQETLVYYNLNDHKMYIDRTKSGKSPGGNFPGVYSQSTAMTADGKIQMHIYVDWSSVEAFGNYGETVGTALIYPDFASTGAEVYTLGGDADVKGTIYPLKSIWREYSDVPVEATDVAINADGSKVDVGDTITISARVLPVASTQKVEWKVSDVDGSAEIVSSTDNTITLRGVKKGGVHVKATVPGTEISAEGILQVIESVFYTNLTGWETVGGSWSIDEKGYLGTGGGDMFTVAKESAKNFTLNADITLEAGDAFGLIFHAKNEHANEGSYVLNFDLSDQANGQRFRIFEFPFRGDATSNVAVKTFADAGFTPERGKTYPVELTVKDGKISFTFDGKEIFKDVVDTNDTQVYTEGRIGFMGYNATVRAQNFYVTTESPIKTVVTQIEDINVMVGAPADEVLAKLPAKVTVEQEDGIQRDVDVVW
ncbi:GH32 C-terminal domain-containing protein, partial [Zongyangia hominis]